MTGLRKTIIERFEEKYIPVPGSGCWLWFGSTSTAGYGTFWLGGKRVDGKYKGKYVFAHRFSFELIKGPIPEGFELDHLCRVPCCVNPDHMEIVTHRINMLRGNTPSSTNAKKTHCKRGHELNDKNTKYRTDGHGRECLPCRRLRDNQEYQNKKLKQSCADLDTR